VDILKKLLTKFATLAYEIDKNLLWGGLNIQKRKLCVKGILAQDLGFVLGAFQRGSGGFSG